MENKEVKYLLAIARHRNITRAAEELFISQPALSRFLKDREEEIGGALFERSATELVPTALGEIYFKYAAAIAKMEDECNAALLERVRQDHRQVHLGIPARRVEKLSGFLAELQARNRDYDFKITTGASGTIWRMGQDGDFDAVVANGYDCGDQGVLLGTEEIVFVVPPVVQKRCRLCEIGRRDEDGIGVIPLSAIAGEEFCLSEEKNMIGAMAQMIFASEGITPQKVRRFDDSRLTSCVGQYSDSIFLFIVNWNTVGESGGENLFRLERRYYNRLYFHQFNREIPIELP